MPHRLSRGFTLIELLIVVAILAVVVALIAPTLGGERRIGLRTEADRLARMVETARVEAVAEGRQWGLRFFPRAYAFERYDEGRRQWTRTGGDFPDRYKLPEDLDLVLSVEARQVGTFRSTKSPQVLILSSGEITPFTVELFSISSQDSCLVNCDGLERTNFSCA